MNILEELKKRVVKQNPYDGKYISRKTLAALSAGILLVTSGITIHYIAESQLDIGKFPKEIIEDTSIGNLGDMDEGIEIGIIPSITEIMPTEEEILINFYSNIYGIDSKKVYEIISGLTNQFQDEAYVEHYVIGDSTMKKRHVDCTSKEMAILIAVRSIYFLPEKYQTTREELDTGIEYVSDLDYSHQIAYISNVVGVDPALHYAICRSECGFDSPMFLKKHNPSGIRFDGEYATFPSFMAGFIEQALELLKYQIDGKTTIEEIGSSHAPNEHGENPYWIGNVTAIYQEAIENYDSLFGSPKKQIQKVLAF